MSLPLILFVGVANAFCISTARALNTRLSAYLGAIKTSQINHLIAILVLVIAALLSNDVTEQFQFDRLKSVPLYVYFGGVIGGIFVASQSLVAEKIGLAKSCLYLIAGQFITGFIIDRVNNSSKDFRVLEILAIALIILGFGLGRRVFSLFKEFFLGAKNEY